MDDLKLSGGQGSEKTRPTPEQISQLRSGKKPHRFLEKRWVVQALATVAGNPHLMNFVDGKIYQGQLKNLCVPGLNCYSCPGATGACPIGALQAVSGSPRFKFPFYVVGLLLVFGLLCGRFVCGFLCPFGWFQDLLHKIPSKKLRTSKLRFLTYIKYVILIVVVLALPVLIADKTGLGSPYFCKYVCPQGLLGGSLPLLASGAINTDVLGGLFLLKSGVLVAVIITGIAVYRPFCKWICPLGAFYAVCNKFSLLTYKVDSDKCIHCGKCAKECYMEVDITKAPDDLECIRCGKCITVCPTDAIRTKWGFDLGGGETTGKGSSAQNQAVDIREMAVRSSSRDKI